MFATRESPDISMNAMGIFALNVKQNLSEQLAAEENRQQRCNEIQEIYEGRSKVLQHSALINKLVRVGC